MNSWLSDIWHKEAGRRPLWLAPAFGAGAALYFVLPEEPAAITSLAIVAPAILALALSRNPMLRPVAWVALFLALGFAAGQLRIALVEAPKLTRMGPRVEAEVCVHSVVPKATYTRIVVGDWAAGTPLPDGFRAQLRWRSPPPDLKPGERLWVSVRLYPVSGAVFPGAYDPKRIAHFAGIGGEGWIGKTTKRAGICREPTSLEEARRWFRSKLLAFDSSSAGGIMVGVTTGWRGDIERSDITAMRDSGLGHLLAISGLHVGLLVGLVIVSLRIMLAAIPALALRFPIKKWAAVAGLSVGIIYLAFSGGSVPTQRAMIMLALVLTALLFDRVEISMRPIAWAAVIVLAFAPEAILSPSFQLSFAAVIGLVAVYETWRRHRQTRARSRFGWPFRYIAGVAATTLIASLATMPFAAFHFHRIALAGVAANLLAVPVFAFCVMPALLLGTLLLPFGLEEVPWGFALAGIGVILETARTVSMWDGSVARVGPMASLSLACIAVGGLWWAIWQHSWRWLGVPLALAGLTLGVLSERPHLIIDDRRIALLAGGANYWIQGRQGFVTDIWMRETAGTPKRWPVDGTPATASGTNDYSLRCDAQACLHRSPQGVIALVDDPAASADCSGAEYAIGRFGAGACTPWPREGEVRQVFLSEQGPSIISTSDGNRPWDR